MSYNVQVKQSYKEDFLQIIQTLQKLGMVESCETSNEMSLPNLDMEDKDILAMLKNGEDQMANGQYLNHEDALKFLQLWKKLRKK